MTLRITALVTMISLLPFACKRPYLVHGFTTNSRTVFLSRTASSMAFSNIHRRHSIPCPPPTNRPYPSRLQSTQSCQPEAPPADTKDGRIPVNLLAGFLGSGKTSTLLNLLTNKDGMRIGVVVNDVASVNIDQKLIANPSNTDGDGNALLSSDETVELQNGCACCSLADELMDSITQLTANIDKRPLDAIVVELSGVADPNAVFENFRLAEDRDHPATFKSKMGSVITLIDSCTFGSDYMTEDSFGDREGWVVEGDDCSGGVIVPELLAEQVEAADVLLVNKVDMAEEKEVDTAVRVARGLNKDAGLYRVEFGKVGVEKILGDDFKKEEEKCTDPGCSDPGCADPNCSEKEGKEEEKEKCTDPGCSDPACSDPTCSDNLPTTNTCTDPDCADPDCTEHNEQVTTTDDGCSDPACSDPDCSDPTCSDNIPTTTTCTDPDCADPDCTEHNEQTPTTTPTPSTKKSTTVKDLGITSFVYRSPIPFNPLRLMNLLNVWPVPVKDTLDLDALAEAAADGYKDVENPTGAVTSVFTGVLRSKGFCWMAPSVWSGSGEDSWRHNTSMYWSHAGKHFGINVAGSWWGSITKEEMKTYFTTNTKEYARILKEDWASEEWGDRRQELVFIGVNIKEAEIRGALDDCLLTKEEMAIYRQQARNIA